LSSKFNIPKYKLNEQAKKGLLIADLSNYSKFQKHSVTDPHRDDHFTILVVKSGEFELMVDFEKIKINKPVFLVIFPEQVHQVIRMKSINGWLINVDASILNEELVNYFYTYLTKPIALANNAAITTSFFSLLRTAVTLEFERGNPFVEKSLHATLHAAWELMLSLPWSKLDEDKKQSRGNSIYRQFKLLLEEHYKIWKQPSLYAQEFSISATHLNDVVKEKSGFSISKHIQNRSMLEAKRLLYYTDKTVSEIGFALGYNDPIYFGKLFKKHTQITPLSFRNKFRE
jgi:AraC-like DNA-binding protein